MTIQTNPDGTMYDDGTDTSYAGTTPTTTDTPAYTPTSPDEPSYYQAMMQSIAYTDSSTGGLVTGTTPAAMSIRATGMNPLTDSLTAQTASEAARAAPSTPRGDTGFWSNAMKQLGDLAKSPAGGLGIMSAIGGGVKALADANSKKTKAEIHLADATAASRTSEAETAATIAKNKGSFVASPGASAPVVFNPGTRQAAMTGLINARKK